MNDRDVNHFGVLLVVISMKSEQRSLDKLARKVRDSAGSLLEALAERHSLLSALQGVQRRMHSGCHTNKR
jgi:hypothetical protein